MSLTKAAGPFLSAAYSSGLTISWLSLDKALPALGTLNNFLMWFKKEKRCILACLQSMAVYVLSDKEAIINFQLSLLF